MHQKITSAAPRSHLIAELSRADWVTSAAVLIIISAFWTLWLNQVYLAVGLAFTSMFLDYVDGAVARRYGGSPYGAILDSLYDVLGWVLFPALVINLQLHWAWWSVVVTSLYCVAAVIRLSRFTVSGYVQTNQTNYIGLPVLFSKYALLLAFVPPLQPLAVVFLAAMLPLMVSSRLIPKPHPIWAQLEIVYAALFVWMYFVHD